MRGAVPARAPPPHPPAVATARTTVSVQPAPCWSAPRGCTARRTVLRTSLRLRVTDRNWGAVQHPSVRTDWTAGVGLCSEARLTERGDVLSGLGRRSRRLQGRADGPLSVLSGVPWGAPWGVQEVWPCLCFLLLSFLHTPRHTVLSSSQPCAWLPSPGPLSKLPALSGDTSSSRPPA